MVVELKAVRAQPMKFAPDARDPRVAKQEMQRVNGVDMPVHQAASTKEDRSRWIADLASRDGVADDLESAVVPPELAGGELGSVAPKGCRNFIESIDATGNSFLAEYHRHAKV
jgi:hypothetical protein